MHECDGKRRHKRFRGVDEKCYFHTSIFRNQPRSPFRIFIESFWKTCTSEDLYEVEERGFQEWRNMSKEERDPYAAQAKEIDLAYQKDLIKESQDASKDSKEDEEADSAEVAKFDWFYEYHTNGEQGIDRFESSNSFGEWSNDSNSWMYKVFDNYDESGSSFH